MIRKYAILLFVVIISSCEPSQNENTTILRLYGDALDDIGYSVASTDGGYVIGGQFTEVVRDGNYIQSDSSLKKLGIIKTDPEGTEIWKKSFGGNKIAAGSKVIVLNDGSIVSTGYVIDPANNQQDVFVVKISSDGTLFSEKIPYPQPGNQYGIDILQTQEGFIILGSTDLGRPESSESPGNIPGNKDVYLLRVDNNFNPIGTPKATGYPGNDAAVAIKNDHNGGYVITGTTDFTLQNQTLNNIFILTAKINGEINKGPNLIGTTDDEYASDIEVLDDGYLIAGVAGSNGSDQSVYLTKMPLDIMSDQPVFTRKFKVTSTSSTATSFYVRAVSRYKTDSFVFAGQAGNGASSGMLIFVTDSEGNQLPGNEMITSSTGTQASYDVLSDDSDNIIAVGKNSFENNSMISFLKIRF
jgi:hypothetical protein